MRAILSALVLVVVGACYTGPSQAPAPLRVSYGSFRFVEHPAGIATPFEGTITVAADEIDVDTRDAGCFTVVLNDPKAQAFQCGEYYVRAQRVGEGWEFRYGTHRDVESRYTVCDTYATTPDGKRVCTSQHEEIRTRSIPVNGSIRLIAETMPGFTP